MNPVDNNPNLRGTRVDTNSTARRGNAVAPADSGANGTVSGADETSTESVSLTRAASDLLALETQLRELPGIDQARVDAIRQAIDDGSYEVDTGRIVDNLLQSERELR